MYKITANKKSIELTEDEFKIVQKLLKTALEFEKESYSFFSDISICNNMKDVRTAMKEMIEDEKEIDLIIALNTDDELINKINNVITL